MGAAVATTCEFGAVVGSAISVHEGLEAMGRQKARTSTSVRSWIGLGGTGTPPRGITHCATPRTIASFAAGVR